MLALEVPGCVLGMALAAVPPIGAFFSLQVHMCKAEKQRNYGGLAKSDHLCPQAAPWVRFFSYMRGQKALIKGLFSTNERP